MTERSEYVFEVSIDDFEQKVIAASHEKVVLVDFWAEWCSPCKMLGPVLEKTVASFNGRVVLAKVNVDNNRELAMRFRIQSIPSVKIFSRGDVVDEFIGVISESEILARLTSAAGDEKDEMIHHADALLQQEHLPEAEALYKKILQEIPDHSGALIGLARIALMNDDTVQAQELLSKVDQFDNRHEEAASLLGILDFIKVCNDSGGFDSCRSKLQQNPDDLDALYTMGNCFAAEARFEEALETFLGIVKRNATFGNGKARLAMITIFSILGHGNPVTSKYRELLARVLF
ncbi:thioredoxin [bacterium]|nr:thioredoxin [bacterium]